MPMYLLDTNVVSELRRKKPHGAVLAWLDGVPARDIFVGATTIGELQAGIEITRARDSSRARALEMWLDRIVATSNVLPMDAAVFRQWARMMYGRSGDLSEDAMIAATALVHGLTVATRNVRDFVPFGVSVLDPFV